LWFTLFMWTAKTRGRMVEIERKTKRYLTDLTDEEWAQIEPFLPRPARRGRRRETDLREVMNAIRYLARTGCGWRMLPKDFPPWQTVYWWFRRFVRLMLFRTIHNIAVMIDRERAGREASPSAGVLDSQTIKAPAAGAARGYDGAKRTVGRKRHVVVDTDGRLLMVNMTTADVSDSAGAREILGALRKRWPWLTHLFADSAYDRGRLLDKAAFLDFTVEVVRRIDKDPGFKLLPRRWVVERTFAWLTRWRRLVRDYEARIDVSEAMNHVALGSILLRRISH
jgi:putative transposase